jgi:hypothetical protein
MLLAVIEWGTWLFSVLTAVSAWGLAYVLIRQRRKRAPKGTWA